MMDQCCPYCEKKQKTKTNITGPPKLHLCDNCNKPFHPQLRTR